MTSGSPQEVAVYQSEDGALQIEARVAGETIWLPMDRIADLFGVTVPAISKHVMNIYANAELVPEGTVSKMETARQEGRPQVTRPVEF
jgi:hypothetical protein